jgi:very-short-patch-repair endonuclease
LPKVRLLDLIEPRRGEGFMSALGKIQSKHVDFVICDQNLYIKAIVELDDKSHDQPDRQERDRFVDDVLTSVGYTVIRTRAVTEDTLLPLA